ncbi:MAG: hypothetical protein WD638_08800 [Nitriliruptoraceae bacterium]
MRSPERSPEDIAAHAEDPLSADRRTLVIAAIAMVALVLVGVVSGALFATSACDDIAPEAVASGEAGDDPAGIVVGLGGSGALTDGELEEATTAAAAELGALTGVADVAGASAIVSGPSGVAALGSTTTLLDPDGSAVEGTAFVGDGTVVGSGETLYSLALTNELTGQVDALQPLDGDLEGLTCVDTALVGSPLAFHLAAGQGELLLLRIDEDGEEPALELRDPVAGRVWATDIELPTAPAGLAGARLTAGLGDDLVVSGTRVGPDDEVPVLTALARDDGSSRWSVGREELVAAGARFLEDGATRVAVDAVGGPLVVVGLRAVDGGGSADEEAEQDARAEGEHLLVGLDVDDGSVAWTAALGRGERVLDAAVVAGRAEVVLADASAGTVRWASVDASGLVERASAPMTAMGSGEGSDAAPGSSPAGEIAVLDDGRVVVALGQELLMARQGGLDVRSVRLPAVGVSSVGDGVAVLLGGDGDRRVAVTFRG